MRFAADSCGGIDKLQDENIGVRTRNRPGKQCYRGAVTEFNFFFQNVSYGFVTVLRKP